MQIRVGFFVFCIVFMGATLFAQTAVTTSGGTVNAVSKFSGSGSIVNSAITEANGNVGVGTSTPQAVLDIYGWSQSAGPGSGIGITIHNGSGEPQWASTTRILFEGGSPGDGAGIQPFAMIQAAGTDYDSTNGFLGFQTSQGGTLAEQMRINSVGNVGIGTTNPGAKLEVNGNIKLTNGSGASITFADGTIQSTAWTGSLCGGDYAESVNVSGDRKEYEPGDVLVLSGDDSSDVARSTQPYSALVAGIYSTKPGLIGRRQKAVKSDTEIPMAMVGIVPTKVSTENGPIKRGDLLVTSSTEGYAMKGTDRNRMLGAIVGKAMGSIDAGTGVIEVLVSLQ